MARAFRKPAASSSSMSRVDECASPSTSMRSSARGCISAPGSSGSPKSSGTIMFNSLGRWFRRQSVGRKLSTTALATTGATLMAACSVFAVYDYINLRSRLVRDVTMLADVVGTNSTAALTFKDAAAAAETLRAAAANEHILDARLFTRDGTLLATYMRQGASRSHTLPEEVALPGIEALALFEGNQLRVVRSISLNGEIIGS